jgi:hypothetical protein
VDENKGAEKKNRRAKATRLLKTKQCRRAVGMAAETHKTVTMADIEQSGLTVR